METVVEPSRAVVQDAGSFRRKGDTMRVVKGLQGLIDGKADLPKVGWIFVDKEFDKTSAISLKNATFHVPEDEDDEFFGEDNLATWLEAPTFLAVLELREKNLKAPSLDQYAEAAIHYLERDDFLE